VRDVRRNAVCDQAIELLAAVAQRGRQVGLLRVRHRSAQGYGQETAGRRGSVS